MEAFVADTAINKENKANEIADVVKTVSSKLGEQSTDSSPRVWRRRTSTWPRRSVWHESLLPRRTLPRMQIQSGAYIRRAGGCAGPKTSWHGTVVFLVYDRARWKTMFYMFHTSSWLATPYMSVCAIFSGSSTINLLARGERTDL